LPGARGFHGGHAGGQNFQKISSFHRGFLAIGYNNSACNRLHGGIEFNMTRREFIGSTAAAGTALAQTRTAKPNIIFILSDDLGYGDVGCYGQKRIKTPNLDRLAAEGMKFTQAYAGSTVCAPSRCCLMTGKHTGHASVRGNKLPELGLRPNEPTVASLLKSAGYKTALFGKWGLGGFDMNSHPGDKGFDEFFGYLNQHHAHLSYPDYLWDNRSEFFLKENWFNQRKTFSNDLFTQKALDFLNQQGTQPVFLYLSYTIPHADNELTKLQANGMEVPDQGIYKRENWPDVERSFAAAVTRMDSDIGRVLETLHNKGMDENTLVIFSSDNGPHREGGHDPAFFRSWGPLRGTKRDLYEGGVREPTMARWKGKISPGQVSDFAWAFWDFLPTATEAAGLKAPPGIDGVSILPTLLGRKQAPHAFLYWEFFEGGFQQAVRQGDWKLVRQAPKFKTELFNLKDDLAESRDVSAQHADVTARLEKLFKMARVDHPEFPTNRKVESVPF
jgi:arylsulfatase A-like enzyme